MNNHNHDTTVVSGHGDNASEWLASAICITLPGQSDRANDVTVYCPHDRIDGECHRLSAAMPDAVIRIYQAARFRIEYKGGVRTKVRSMQDFYSNIDDAANQSYLVHNSKYNPSDKNSTFYI